MPVAIGVELMVSCGAEVETLRDVATRVISLSQHMFRYEMGVPITITQWDYRDDAPRVVHPDDFATRSLAMVERADGIIAILGREVPEVTKKEILHTFKLRSEGIPKRIWLYLHPNLKGAAHVELQEQVVGEYGELPVYAPYTSELELQGKLFTALTPFLLGLTDRNVVNAQGAVA